MSAQENKTIARLYFEDVWNKKNLAAIDKLFAANFAGHALDTTIQGSEALKQRVSTGYSEDIHFSIEDVVAEEDRVCVRWMYRATIKGKQAAATGMHLFRIAGGKIEEFWINMNEAGA